MSCKQRGAPFGAPRSHVSRCRVLRSTMGSLDLGAFDWNSALGWRRGADGPGRKHANDRHHPVVFVAEDVAVIDEVSDIRTPEVHAQGYARIRMRRVTIPEGDLNHVQELAILLGHRRAAVDLEVVLR